MMGSFYRVPVAYHKKQRSSTLPSVLLPNLPSIFSGRRFFHFSIDILHQSVLWSRPVCSLIRFVQRNSNLKPALENKYNQSSLTYVLQARLSVARIDPLKTGGPIPRIVHLYCRSTRAQRLGSNDDFGPWSKC